MKIGILTFHRAYNYGAVLQCYALQQHLLSLGHEVYVIDYRQPWTESLRNSISYGKIKQLSKHPKGLLVYLLSSFKRKKKLKRSALLFDDFVNKYLNVRNTCRNRSDFPQDYDCYIIGSDQVWGKSCLGGEFDNVYMGDFTHNINSKVIGYAISSTAKSIKELGQVKLQNISNRFSALSFREQNIAKRISHICNKTYPECIDPTLLCNSSVWTKLINKKWSNKEYILIYEARDATKHPQLLYLKAKRMLELNDKDYEIIDMSNMVYSVSDFVTAIKYAQCVITTSFHATVFSIIFNRPFYSIKLEDGADDRYVNLLNQLHFEQQCVLPNFEPSTPRIDYSDIENRLARYRDSSVEYLNISLS